LQIYFNDKLKDEIYVAISERSRRNLRYTNPQYLILGYALKNEVLAHPKRKCYFIRFLDLHPIHNLNRSDYLDPVRVGDLTWISSFTLLLII